MTRHAPDPAIKAAALEALRAGGSFREVAAAVGVSQTTIARWAKDADPAELPARLGGTAAVAPEIAERAAKIVGRIEPATIPAVEALPDDASALLRVRAILAEADRALQRGRASGDLQLIQRATRDSAMMLPVLARLEAQAAESGDVLHVTHASIEEAMAGVEKRVAALLDRPLLCAECGRALAIKIGKGEK